MSSSAAASPAPSSSPALSSLSSLSSASSENAPTRMLHTKGPAGKNSAERCCVCFDTMDPSDPTITHASCQQSFHQACFASWQSAHSWVQIKRCPACQQELAKQWWEFSPETLSLIELRLLQILFFYFPLSTVWAAWYLHTRYDATLRAIWTAVHFALAVEMMLSIYITDRVDMLDAEGVFTILFLAGGMGGTALMISLLPWCTYVGALIPWFCLYEESKEIVDRIRGKRQEVEWAGQ